MHPKRLIDIYEKKKINSIEDALASKDTGL